MTNQKLNVNDIIASVSRYNGETQLYTFYKVVKVLGNGEKVRLQQLKKRTRYDREADGNIYYNTYHESVPLDIPATDKTILRQVKYYDGEPVISISNWNRAYGVWNGEPLEEYNLH